LGTRTSRESRAPDTAKGLSQNHNRPANSDDSLAATDGHLGFSSSITDRAKGGFGVEGNTGKAVVFGMGVEAGRTFYKGVAGQIGAETIKSYSYPASAKIVAEIGVHPV
jgi:hypothetical protein